MSLVTRYPNTVGINIVIAWLEIILEVYIVKDLTQINQYF